jgi:hypothetical protein
MSFLIGKFGVASLINMASLLGVMFISVCTFIFVDNGHDAKEIREALKTLPKAHYVVFMLYRSQISGNSRKDRSVTEYDKKPYLL